jgi:hypothetical protein
LTRIAHRCEQYLRRPFRDVSTNTSMQGDAWQERIRSGPCVRDELDDLSHGLLSETVSQSSVGARLQRDSPTVVVSVRDETTLDELRAAGIAVYTAEDVLSRGTARAAGEAMGARQVEGQR